MGERKQGLQVPYMVCSQNGSKATKLEVFTRDGMSYSTAPPAQAFNGGQQQQCNKITFSTQKTQKLPEKDTNSSPNTTIYFKHYYYFKLEQQRQHNTQQPLRHPQCKPFVQPPHVWDDSIQPKVPILRSPHQQYY